MTTAQLPLTGLELKEQGIKFGDSRLPLRFWRKVSVNDNGCWEWIGATNSNGYGHMRLDGRMQYVHRILYQRCKGLIPTGFTLDHLCRTRSCVNLQHLEAVTSTENIRRGEGFAGLRSRQTRCIHGHEFDESNTYIASNGTRHCRTCDRHWQAQSRQRAKRRMAQQVIT